MNFDRRNFLGVGLGAGAMAVVTFSIGMARAGEGGPADATMAYSPRSSLTQAFQSMSVPALLRASTRVTTGSRFSAGG